MLLYRGVVPRLYFVEMVRWWCYIVWQRVCDIMQKYTVKNKKSGHGGFYVLLNTRNNETTIESFPYRFAVDMNLGDCVRELGHGDFVRAWSTGDKLFLPLEPVVDWRLRAYWLLNFVYSNWGDFFFIIAGAQCVLQKKSCLSKKPQPHLCF